MTQCMWTAGLRSPKWSAWYTPPPRRAAASRTPLQLRAAPRDAEAPICLRGSIVLFRLTLPVRRSVDSDVHAVVSGDAVDGRPYTVEGKREPRAAAGGATPIATRVGHARRRASLNGAAAGAPRRGNKPTTVSTRQRGERRRGTAARRER
jgi:hypothetical protein